MKKAAMLSPLLFCSMSLIAQGVTEESLSFHEELKNRFLEGGWEFMSLTLLCLLFGLLIFIQKLYDLNSRTDDNQKFLEGIEANLNSGINPINNLNRGTLYRICAVGIEQQSRGFDKVLAAIESAISVERGNFYKGLTWLSLFISLAPMLGFMGTVLGMITAFDAISEIDAGGNMSPGLVAGGIKVALITTVSGLVIAVVLQLLYNYLLNKIESVMINLEDSCSTFIDLLIINQLKSNS